MVPATPVLDAHVLLTQGVAAVGLAPARQKGL
jgi:hypothetical protein